MRTLDWLARWRCGTLVVLAAVAPFGGCGGASTPAGGCADPSMIDDLEDGDRFICDTAGRHGAWYVASDGTSPNLSPKGEFKPTLIPGATDENRYAARMTGFGFAAGAWMGLSLAGEGDARTAYDAHTHGGIRFRAKTDIFLSVVFPTAETVAAGQPGGACVDEEGTINCGNHFVVPAFTTSNLGTWAEYDIPFSAAIQETTTADENGNSIVGNARWDPSHLVEIVFAAEAPSFDVWIDDVRFYDCEGAACLQTCTVPDAPVSCPAGGGFPAGCWPAGTDCAKQVAFAVEGVWASGRDDVWAVGYAAPYAQLTGAIAHWDGLSWSMVALDPTVPPLLHVWGSGPDDVWAVGEHGAVVHWDGVRWSAVATGVDSSLRHVWGSGPGDLWAVGVDGTVLHGAGGVWSRAARLPGSYLTAVWGTGPSDVWVVGFPNLLARWDGATWSTSVLNDISTPMALWGSGPDDVWVTGAMGEIARWNGTRWSPTPSGTSEILSAVWGSGPDDVWVVGMDGTLLHWNGLAWSGSKYTTPQFLGVWGSDGDDVWAVGAWNGFLHWNGVAWTPVSGVSP